MKQWIIGAAIALSTAGAAQAQTITNDAFDQTASLPSWAKVVTFDSPLPTGFSLNGGKVVRGNGSGYAAPAGDATNYLVADRTSATVTADKGYQSVGFYWGSIDSFNAVKLLDAAGKLIASFTGADIPPANGDQGSGATNRYVSYTLDPAQGFSGIASIVFASTGTSFEVDNVAFGTKPGSPAPVPEPATLGLFAVGLAALGRRLGRKRTA
ncbi:PEP-CTERM sorting domain-containing protein [Sphingomonas sp.]|uniref:Npun_F0296 family exosortase-dependent surface protein n=1 Tax=Sphingomonas sp. TaxID=28214 RepID=UPI0035C7E1B6